jgi:formamidopyrimidine-DNA glycosylase
VPELPEVETTRRRLLPLLEGKRLLEVRHQDPSRYRHTERARERAVEGVGRRGKFLLLALSGGLEMVVHLGMTGGFRLEKTPTPGPSSSWKMGSSTSTTPGASGASGWWKGEPTGRSPS